MYLLVSHGTVVATLDRVVPVDPGNAVRWWPDDEPVPLGLADPAPARPECYRRLMVVSRFRALAALAEVGLLDAVEAAMASPDTDPLTRLAWREASEFERLDPLVQRVGALLGITDEQLDALFVAAGAAI